FFGASAANAGAAIARTVPTANRRSISFLPFRWFVDTIPLGYSQTKAVAFQPIRYNFLSPHGDARVPASRVPLARLLRGWHPRRSGKSPAGAGDRSVRRDDGRGAHAEPAVRGHARRRRPLAQDSA